MGVWRGEVCKAAAVLVEKRVPRFGSEWKKENQEVEVTVYPSLIAASN